MFQKILCPIDFSPGSQEAMTQAVQLATEADGGIVLTYVWYIRPVMVPGESPFTADTIEVMRADNERALTTAVTSAAQLGARHVTSRFLTGVPWESIVNLVRDDPSFDLISVGTHGRTGLARILLGSVAQKVLRHAPCSVLVARARTGVAAPTRILCAIDFSEHARAVVARAAELAAARAAELTLMHVVEAPMTFSGDPPVAVFMQDLDRRSAHLLEEWAAELRTRTSLPITALLRLGSPGAQILRAVDDDPRVDLVVMGSHGRTGLARIALGSVAEKVTRHVPCSVLVVRGS